MPRPLTKRDRLADGDRIRRIRERAGIKQTELADQAGISRSHMNKIESGAEQPAIETLARIAIELGCDLDDVTEPADA